MRAGKPASAVNLPTSPSGNQDTAEAIRAALIEAGFDAGMINIAPFYADTLRMGLEKGADVFTILMRTSQPEDAAAFEQWMHGAFRIDARVSRYAQGRNACECLFLS